MDEILVLPKIKEYELPMVKSCETLYRKIELLGIYHFLKSHMKGKVSYRSFGPMIGIDLPKQTLCDWLKNEDKYRMAST
ncbi:hypothetical protein DFQ27_000905 [Actinomortierella ambigua]|uniref:Uncharacterized protein n=1 Tax=Actinomortierella ambigua TaxID=1343610 RepID=A0A9P6QBY2_9FUNG|nr:hypothetical protein DFQ27_000905 [Actinomortierella ambigua]